ncbi:MAG: plastocyanin/azurin family copper-binding protein [Solirubrobacteraceae bacterium]
MHLAAVPGKLAFDTKTLKAKAGTVTVTMSNPSSIPHGIAVEGNGVDKDAKVVQQGGTSTLTVKLKPGTYTFYCPVSGHRQAGMEGTLTVS